MIKFAEKDNDYIYIYSENPDEIEYLKGRTKAVFTDIMYEGCPAILVRKETRKRHMG